jgi:GT2 family glycosyltransferase
MKQKKLYESKEIREDSQAMSKRLSIILATYGQQNQKYLDDCLESLSFQSFKDFEVLLVSSGEYVPAYSSWKKYFKIEHLHNHERMHFPEAVHLAYQKTDPSSEYLMLLNDDIILNKNCLHHMMLVVEKAGFESVVNPASNCDVGRRYIVDLELEFNHQHYFFSKAQYKYDEIHDQRAVIMEGNYHPSPMLIFTQWVAFYATLMKRSTWEKVGGIDFRYRTGKDDLDFCLRAQKHNIHSTICMHAFALHYSGTTADIFLSDEDREFNEVYFSNKFKL